MHNLFQKSIGEGITTSYDLLLLNHLSQKKIIQNPRTTVIHAGHRQGKRPYDTYMEEKKIHTGRRRLRNWILSHLNLVQKETTWSLILYVVQKETMWSLILYVVCGILQNWSLYPHTLMYFMGLGYNDPWAESHMWPQQTWGQRSSRGQWLLVQVFEKEKGSPYPHTLTYVHGTSINMILG